MAGREEVDNSIYDQYGEDWYEAWDDPVALLRAENLTKTPWILEKIHLHFREKVRVLDVGCGGGFLSNALAREGHSVTGVDLSSESLQVARSHDETQSVVYEVADAFHLPYEDGSFEVVSAMDFLEHVEEPAKVIQEFSRVLKPGGLFFYHTFNRNIFSWLIVIKLVEWLIPKTPKNMHVLRLFIKPDELKTYCSQAGLKVWEEVGIRPVLSSIPFSQIFSGKVPKGLRFTLTDSLLLSYLGCARKQAIGDSRDNDCLVER